MADDKNKPKNPYSEVPAKPWLAKGERQSIMADTTGMNTIYSNYNINKHGRPTRTAEDVQSDIEKHLANRAAQRKRNK